MVQGLGEPTVEDRNPVGKVCNSQRRGRKMIIRPGY